MSVALIKDFRSSRHVRAPWGAGAVALHHLHVADPAVRHREIALPRGVAGIGLRQAVDESELCTVRFQRPGEVP
jgi:hypothetical protein